MNQSISARRISVLLGSASFCTLAVTAANAQVAEVLITGSIIAGAPAVGVPVTNLGAQDFLETGAVNVLELLETVPALTVPPTNSPAFGAGTLHFANNVQIHGLGDGDTLMMQDGRRWPLQGYDGFRVDPAIFPQLAIDRVDVLAAGASATYGADAVAGVLNVILKRGFEGAQTFVRLGAAPGAGNENVTFSQLYGTGWDTGNITVTYEHQTNRHVEASDLFYYTWNFDEAGFEGYDFTLVDWSDPGFITLGRSGPSSANRQFVERNKGVLCNNCYALPAGIGWDFDSQAPGPTVDWSQVSLGINTAHIQNPWDHGWARPSMESNSFVATFSQRLLPNLSLFGVDFGPVRLIADGIYSNRRFKQNYPADQGQGRENATTSRDGYLFQKNNENPYIPTGLPANFDPNNPAYPNNPGNSQGLRAHWSLNNEIDTPIVSGGQVNGRWRAGLEFDELPFNWHSIIDYTLTDNTSYGYDRGGINPNNALAALGNTVTFSTPLGTATLVKPDNVPFLNPFCDARVNRCNSPNTIAWMQGHRDQRLYSHFSELNAQIDGPLFDLPAGPIVIALAFNHLYKSQRFYQEDSTNTGAVSVLDITGDYINELSNSYTFQGNVPLLGPEFNIPLFESLDVEVGYRYDEYDNSVLGTTDVHTPKVGVNWGVGMGLTLRGSWGKSFRTPKGEEIASSGVDISGINAASGVVAVDSIILNCGGGPTPTPGSLEAVLNPTCNQNIAFTAPVGISVDGNPGPTGPLLAGSGLVPPGTSVSLGPQRGRQLNLGFAFTPGPEHFNGFLTGLDIDVSWFKIEYTDLIGGTFAGEGGRDPLSTPYFIPIQNPNAPITDPSNALFWALVQDLAAFPTRTSRAPGPAELLDTKFIQLNLTGNIGRAEQEGIDFDIRYDWDMFNMGSFHVGANGYYEIVSRTQSRAGTPWLDRLYAVPLETLSATGNQLQKVRYRAGWTDGTWNITAFANYFGHGPQDVFGNLLLPDCYHAVGGSAGDCYPGSPYYGPHDPDNFPLASPANVLIDLTFGYNTGTMPANTYLQNIGIQIGVTNLLDKNPPLGVFPLRSRGTGVAAYDRNYSDLKREVSISFTKTW